MKDTFPGITFEFVGGATLCIPPRAYFFEYDRISCIGISRDVDQEQFMLGANAMVDHNVVFDLGQNKLGIAVSKCDHESTHMGLASCKGGIAKHLSPSPLSENDAPSTDPPKVTKTLPSVGSPLAVLCLLPPFCVFWPQLFASYGFLSTVLCTTLPVFRHVVSIYSSLRSYC